MKKSYRKFLLSMIKVGCIGFGGGNAMIPVIEKEVIERQQLDTKSNYDRDVTVANITPGSLTVKMAASLGKRYFGRRGMVIGAFAMALPGCLVALLLFMALSAVKEQLIGMIQIASVGAAAFIIYLLSDYIGKVWEDCWNKGSVGRIKTLSVMVGAFILVCGKNVHKLLGIEGAPIFGISALDILLAAFFVVFYTAGGYRKGNILISVLLCSVFLLSHGKSQLIHNEYLICGVELTMFGLSVCGIRRSIKQNAEIRFEKKRELREDIFIWFGCLMVVAIPMVFFYENGLDFLGNVLLSGAVSFGGGDAYLSIAEGTFVDTGWISEEVYYGQIVSVVNVLPGSILCKTLTGIGYYIGYAIEGSVWDGVVFGVAAFSASVVISCVIFFATYHMYCQFSTLATIQKITRWIRPMAAGLLINVILSLCNQGMNTARNLAIASWQMTLLLLGVAICNLICDRRFGIKSGWLLAFDLCVATVILR